MNGKRAAWLKEQIWKDNPVIRADIRKAYGGEGSNTFKRAKNLWKKMSKQQKESWLRSEV